MASPDAATVERVVALYLAVGFAYPRTKGYDPATAIAELAPVPEIPDLARRTAQLHLRLATKGVIPRESDALVLRARDAAYGGGGSTVLSALRLGGATPGETAVMLSRALHDPSMGAARLLMLLTTATQFTPKQGVEDEP